MPTIDLEVPSPGQVVASGLHAANYADLQALLNGALDSSNLADGAVTIAKINATGTPGVTNFLRGDGSWQAVNAPSVVTSLPGSPVDGQEVYFVASDSGGIRSLWHFRYNASGGGSYKWEYLGGCALYNQVDTAEASTSTSYAALATAGPSLTVPLAGNYDIEIGCLVTNTNTGGASFMSYDIGATGAIDADAVREMGTGSDARPGSISRVRNLVVTAAATAVVAKYKTSGTSTTFANRFMRIIPRRVA